MKLLLLTMLLAICALSAFGQVPKIDPGEWKDLAAWRAARYSDVRYKLNLKLEKMSPVLKGSVEIRLNVGPAKVDPSSAHFTPLIILDWRKIAEHEKDSTISNVTINGISVILPPPPGGIIDEELRIEDVTPKIGERDEHLIFSEYIRPGENVIKLDFTSPILVTSPWQKTSGSAVLWSVDTKEGLGHIDSNFVPSIASTAFPMFDQPDLKARLSLTVEAPGDWKVVWNSNVSEIVGTVKNDEFDPKTGWCWKPAGIVHFEETKPISIYEFNFKAWPKK